MKYSMLYLMIGLFVINIQANDDVLYKQDFDEIVVGDSPSDFLVLEGDFSVKDHDGSNVLLLPGTPLSDYGILFGPSQADGIQISARIQSERQKRLFPRIGVGLGGVNGYKLFITPSKRALEIVKGKETVESIPFKWQSGKWAQYRFQIRKVDEQWVIEGKAWHGTEEPKEWMIVHKTEDQPVASKPSIWGTPYSSQDIYFDDIVVKPAS